MVNRFFLLTDIFSISIPSDLIHRIQKILNVEWRGLSKLTFRKF